MSQQQNRPVYTVDDARNDFSEIGRKATEKKAWLLQELRDATDLRHIDNLNKLIANMALVQECVAQAKSDLITGIA